MVLWWLRQAILEVEPIQSIGQIAHTCRQQTVSKHIAAQTIPGQLVKEDGNHATRTAAKELMQQSSHATTRPCFFAYRLPLTGTVTHTSVAAACTVNNRDWPPPVPLSCCPSCCAAAS